MKSPAGTSFTACGLYSAMFASDTALHVCKQGCKKEGRSKAQRGPNQTIELLLQCFAKG
jgi:hypothetical protein